MKQEDFAEIVAQQIERVSAILGVKTEEYATHEDQLHNLRISALIQGESLPEAAAGMMAKHTASIFTMVKSGRPYPTAKWDEKITDHIVWLILLKAALVEGARNPVEADISDVLRARMAEHQSATVDVSQVLLGVEGEMIAAPQILRLAADILDPKRNNPS